MIYSNWRECLTLFFVRYFRVPLKGCLLYYFPHILAEYNTWINNLHIFILQFVPKKCGLQGYPAHFFSPGLADGLIIIMQLYWVHSPQYMKKIKQFRDFEYDYFPSILGINFHWHCLQIRCSLFILLYLLLSISKTGVNSVVREG